MCQCAERVFGALNDMRGIECGKLGKECSAVVL